MHNYKLDQQLTHTRSSDSQDVTAPSMSFSETVRARKTVRQFLKTPLSDSTLRAVLEEAQYAPSNCNTQIWDVHVVSGSALKKLSENMLAAHYSGQESTDFSFDIDAFKGRYRERNNELGKHYYESLGVKREDREGRAKAVAKNYEFFDAPHVAFLFMPTVGDSVRTAGDLGHYGQTLMLSLASRGLGSIPLTSASSYTNVIRETLGIPKEMKFLYAIAFGFADTHAPSYAQRMGRDPIESCVTFHK
ncbi:MAG: nitroreductase [Pseudobdellovibrionaceae bacterium]|nr:nitroreductase [Pseudobdellovibrionaceae bacterium]